VTDEDAHKLVIGGGIIVALAAWKGRTVAQQLADFTTRGARLTVTTLDASGNIPDDPDELAAAASAVVGYDVPIDIYSLARMGRSEGVNGKEIRMHVALNDLADLHTRAPSIATVTDLVTYSTHAGARGHYGSQSGRRYSTARDPYENDLRLAVKVWADRQAGIDRAQGAIKFVDKSSFGAQAGTRSYDAVAAEWMAAGLEPFTVADATSDLVLFRRA
jgi:hypothetical protein